MCILSLKTKGSGFQNSIVIPSFRLNENQISDLVLVGKIITENPKVSSTYWDVCVGIHVHWIGRSLRMLLGRYQVSYPPPGLKFGNWHDPDLGDGALAKLI